MNEEGEVRQELKPPERDWRPVPDPTLLTSAALVAGLTALEDKIMARMEGMRDAIAARLDASDQAVRLQEATVTRVPTLLDKELEHHRHLTDEQFERVQVQFTGIQAQFSERDTKVIESAVATRTAVDAALAAAEKARATQVETADRAATKSESNFTKQIDQLGELLRASTKTLEVQIADAKERLTRIEGQTLGQMGARTEGHSTNSFLIAVIVAMISFIGLVITLASRFSGHP